MTEEEAKTKACFRAATFGGSQQLAEGPGPNCIGSACMAWRTVGRPMFRDRGTGRVSDVDLSGNGDWVHPDGFCGLAGTPQ